jgi:hypothetical protein
LTAQGVGRPNMDFKSPDFLRLVGSSISRVDLWSNVITAIHVKSILEIGVWKGQFAREILQGCTGIEKYYMVDPWENLPDWNKPFNVSSVEFARIYEEAMKSTEFASSKRVVLKGRTKDVLDRIPDGSLDFAYIDGDHTLHGITIDLITVLPKIKVGGLLAGDDFEPCPWLHGIHFEPSLVCPFSVYFAEAMELPIIALPHKQFLIEKTATSGFEFTDTTGQYSDLSLKKFPAGIIKYGIKRKVKRWLSKFTPKPQNSSHGTGLISR